MSSHARDEQGPNRQTDEFGNPLAQPSPAQPSTIAMYGGPSNKGGVTLGSSTGDADAFMTGYYGGQPQQEHRPRPGTDPTKRRGTKTGEYGTAGSGFMDRSKDKLADIGGLKEVPGHVNTTGEPMEGSN